MVHSFDGPSRVMKYRCKTLWRLAYSEEEEKTRKEDLIRLFIDNSGLDYIVDVEFYRRGEENSIIGDRYSLVIFEGVVPNDKNFLVKDLKTYLLVTIDDFLELILIHSHKIMSISEFIFKTCVKIANLEIKLLDNIYAVESAVSKLLKSTDRIFFDLETTMIPVYKEGSYIICMSFADIHSPETVYVVYFNHESSGFRGNLEDLYKALSPLFLDPDRIVSAHNINFDRAWVETKFGIQIKSECHCTIGMHHLLDITHKHGLELLSKKYLDIKDMKNELTVVLESIRRERKLKKDECHYDVAPIDILTRYVVNDTFAGAVLYNLFYHKLEQENLMELYKTYSVPCNSKLHELSIKGQNWDMDRCNFILGNAYRYLGAIESRVDSMKELGEYQELYITVSKILKSKIQGIDEKDEPVKYFIEHLFVKILKRGEAHFIPLTALLSTHDVKGKLCVLYYKRKFLLSSSAQVGEILYDIFKFPALVLTEKGKPSTNEKALLALEQELQSGRLTGIPESGILFAKLLFLYRKLNQTKNTYLLGFPDKMGVDNRLHSNFLLFGTDTGRLSSNEPNMQNLPSEEDHLTFNAGVKTCLVPRTPGNVFIEVDFSALELRIVAALAKDSGMIAAFKAGLEDPTKADIHQHMAAVIYRKTYEQVTKQERKFSKTINFGILYGSSKGSICTTLGQTYKQVDSIFDALFKNYPSLKSFIDSSKEKLYRTGFIDNVLGIKYKLLSSEDLESLGYSEPDRKREDLAAKNGHRAGRQAVNYQVQGVGGILMCQCFTEMDNILESKPYPANVIISVHDSALIECPFDKVAEVHDTVIAPVMTRDRDWLNGVPLAFDTKVGRTAGCMIPYSEFLKDPSSIDKKYDAYTEYHSNFENFKRELHDLEVPF